MDWHNQHSSTSRAPPAAFIRPALPTPSKRVPVGSHWIHEIKHDGYRVMVRRDGARIRLFTRNGADWSHRFPRIVEAVGRLSVRSATIDGEAVVCGDDDVSDFARLHSGMWDEHVFLYAFDLLQFDGEDLRLAPLEARKARLAKLMANADPGIQFNEHIDLDGALVFEHACKLGLEGIVSKRRDFPYRSGRTKFWIKIKNPASPAMLRLQEDGPW
jgi:bifunctional non-homologous end joining protein LigD